MAETQTKPAPKVAESQTTPGIGTDVSIERADAEQALAEGMAAAENERRRGIPGAGAIPTQEEYRERRAAQQQEMYGTTTHLVDPADAPEETVPEPQPHAAAEAEAKAAQGAAAERERVARESDADLKAKAAGR